MKKLTSLAVVFALVAGAQATLITNDIVQSGNFVGVVNTDHWNFGGDWRDNGADNVVFDAKTTGAAGFEVNKGTMADLTSFANITGDADYNINTTKLIGFNMDGSTTGSRWFKNGNVAVGNAGSLLDLDYFAEIDVITSGGTYRYKSQVFDPMTMGTGWQNIGGGSWQGGSFLGDLEASGGVALSDITEIQYKMVMHQVAANTDGTGTVFILADAIRLNAIVETIPEPGTFGLLTAFSAAILFIRRRFMI